MISFEDDGESIDVDPDRVREALLAVIRAQVAATVEQAVQRAIRLARGLVD